MFSVATEVSFVTFNTGNEIFLTLEFILEFPLIPSSRFHRERDEPALPSDVLLPLRDDKQMSVDDYRNKLYSIMAKGSQGHNAYSKKVHTR